MYLTKDDALKTVSLSSLDFETAYHYERVAREYRAAFIGAEISEGIAKLAKLVGKAANAIVGLAKATSPLVRVKHA